MRAQFSKNFSPKGILGTIFFILIAVGVIYLFFTLLTIALIIIACLILLGFIASIFRKNTSASQILVTVHKNRDSYAGSQGKPQEILTQGELLCTGTRPDGNKGQSSRQIVCDSPIFKCKKCSHMGCQKDDCSMVGFSEGRCLLCGTYL